jgi:hypothetical protein
VGETQQILGTLETHRAGLRRTVDGLSDADVRCRPTVSARGDQPTRPGHADILRETPEAAAR